MGGSKVALRTGLHRLTLRRSGRSTNVGSGSADRAVGPTVRSGPTARRGIDLHAMCPLTGTHPSALHTELVIEDGLTRVDAEGRYQ